MLKKKKKTTCPTACDALPQRLPTDLFRELHRIWVSKAILHPCGSALTWEIKEAGRGEVTTSSTAPSPNIIIYLTSLLSLSCCTSDLIKNTRTNSHCHKSTLFASAWRLLSREYIMPVPCMAGPMPGQ